VLAADDRDWSGEPLPVFTLDREVTSIGSGPDADVRLPDLASVHAQVRHDERDDYVLVLLAPGEAPTSPDGDPEGTPHPQVLRTGATFRIGPWALTFERAEHADHGRPHGGRQGGEGSVQRLQAPRPDYRAEHRRETAAERRADAREGA
jgi:hypothetical protein